jgi:transcriptional regulator with XRE-family HTH domain
MNHTGRCLRRMLELSGISRAELARRCGVSVSYVNNIAIGKAPGQRMLRRLCAAWDEPAHGMRLLEAHLHDEVLRAGRRLEEFEIRTRIGEADTLAADIAVIEQAMGDQALRAKIRFFADLARQRRDQAEDAIAAEPATRYRKNGP